MIHLSDLRRALARLAVLPGDARLLEDDRWRLSQAYYGAITWPTAADGRPTVVLLGARSGLEAAVFALRSAGTTVIVVESGAESRPALANLAQAFPGVKLANDVATARRLLAGRAPDLVRVDGATYDFAAIEGLLGDLRCGHLCGTYHEADIDRMSLYRASRDRLARSFFWHEDSPGVAFGSDRGPVEVEVSVVVPAYKVAELIDPCLESLVHQTLERLEILVIDDGSPDDTGARAQRWADRFPGRVRVIRKENGGCASARMLGLRLARGEYVGFVDGDDWVDRAMFAELYRAAATTGAEVAQCGYAEAFADGSVTDYRGYEAEAGDWPVVLEGTLPLLTERPTIWRRIYRRELLEQHGIGFPEHILRFDDLPFQFEALVHARRVAAIPDAYYFYRQDRPGQTIAVRDKRLFVHFPIFDWLHSRVMPWADTRIEAQLFRVELNTHLWALGRVADEWRAEYRAEAEQQIALHRDGLGPIGFLRVAASVGWPALRLAIAALRRRRPQRPGHGAPDRPGEAAAAGLAIAAPPFPDAGRGSP